MPPVMTRICSNPTNSAKPSTNAGIGGKGVGVILLF